MGQSEEDVISITRVVEPNKYDLQFFQVRKDLKEHAIDLGRVIYGESLENEYMDVIVSRRNGAFTASLAFVGRCPHPTPKVLLKGEEFKDTTVSVAYNNAMRLLLRELQKKIDALMNGTLPDGPRAANTSQPLVPVSEKPVTTTVSGPGAAMSSVLDGLAATANGTASDDLKRAFLGSPPGTSKTAADGSASNGPETAAVASASSGPPKASESMPTKSKSNLYEVELLARWRNKLVKAKEEIWAEVWANIGEEVLP